MTANPCWNWGCLGRQVSDMNNARRSGQPAGSLTHVTMREVRSGHVDRDLTVRTCNVDIRSVVTIGTGQMLRDRNI